MTEKTFKLNDTNVASTNTNTNNININVSSADSQPTFTPAPQTLSAQPSSGNFIQQGDACLQQRGISPTNSQRNMSTLGDQGSVEYPSQLTQNQEQQSTDNFPPGSVVEVQALTRRCEELQTQYEFYKLLATILSNILKDNNPKLIANVIDMSGKIIVTGEELVRLIAIKTGCDPNVVNLRYRDIEPGCMAKVSNIKNISDIKINNQSFSLCYNADYNVLKDDFNISLERVIISPGLTYH